MGLRAGTETLWHRPCLAAACAVRPCRHRSLKTLLAGWRTKRLLRFGRISCVSHMHAMQSSRLRKNRRPCPRPRPRWPEKSPTRSPCTKRLSTCVACQTDQTTGEAGPSRRTAPCRPMAVWRGNQKKSTGHCRCRLRHGLCSPKSYNAWPNRVGSRRNDQLQARLQVCLCLSVLA